MSYTSNSSSIYKVRKDHFLRYAIGEEILLSGKSIFLKNHYSSLEIMYCMSYQLLWILNGMEKMNVPSVTDDTCYMDKVYKVHSECNFSWCIIISPAVFDVIVGFAAFLILTLLFTQSWSMKRFSIFLSLPSFLLWERNFFFTNHEIIFF